MSCGFWPCFSKYDGAVSSGKLLFLSQNLFLNESLDKKRTLWHKLIICELALLLVVFRSSTDRRDLECRKAQKLEILS